jgi:hypothetical protein
MAAPLSPPPPLSLRTGKAVVCHSGLPTLSTAGVDLEGACCNTALGGLIPCIGATASLVMKIKQSAGRRA